MNILRKHFFDFPIRVLIYREGSVIVAHALEFDLLGYGKNENEALQQLLESVKAQISFCSSVNNPEMTLFPAPKGYLERWETAHMASTPTDEKALVLVFDKSGKRLSPQGKIFSDLIPRKADRRHRSDEAPEAASVTHTSPFFEIRNLM